MVVELQKIYKNFEHPPTHTHTHTPTHTLTLTHPPTQALAAVVATPIIYVFGVSLSVSVNSIIGDLAPAGDKRAPFLSKYLTCNDLGAAMGPLLGFWVAPQFGLPLLYTMGMCVFCVMTVLFVAVFGCGGYTKCRA